MFTSVLSGKKKILQNGQVIYFDSKFKSAFQFPFTIGKNSLNIVQHGDKFELRINNQSFTHLWDNERTKRNFNYENREELDPYKQKDYAKNYDQSTRPASHQPSLEVNNRHRHKSQHHGGSSNAGNINVNLDEVTGLDESEIQAQIKAYEELQRKHKREQDVRRGTQVSNSSKPQQDKQYNAYDFATGFDHGFDKFSTNAQGSSSGAGKGSSQASSQNQKKPQPQNDEFDFNFSNSQPQQQQSKPNTFQNTQQKSMPPQTQNNANSNMASNDLFDLLGSGPSSQGGFSAPKQQETSKNALDFFNDLDFGPPQTNVSSNNLQTQQQQPSTNLVGGLDDLMGFGAPITSMNTTQPQNLGGLGGIQQQQQQMPLQQQLQNIPQQQPEAQPENKPKFVPNLAGFYTQNQPMMQSQQELLMQQQMQQQMMMQQMMMNQGFGTNMNAGAGMGGQPGGMGMGMNTNMNMGGAGYGTNMNAGMGGGMGGGNPWDNGFGGQQQQQQQNQNQFMTGMQNQGYQQQQFGGQPSYQQNTYQTSVPQQNYGGSNMGGGAASTPFDLFN
ncbi:UNKNOWN [Stylonychia lemnae]|uniref:Uncharacterized protein n=1 Tax=Stylonychia lemnae TaxID=5949 RepID=A0A077ZY96_STYLE|nr:UNKNOWN [Stylonychia lemnae]|eukprot:CDW74612.1 UNKNOWN [Stylonychia lemnae]